MIRSTRSRSGSTSADANELAYARLVADSIGAVHRDVTVTRREVFDVLPSLIWHEDEPIAFPSSVLLYFVSMLARRDVKVVLTGEGADELFLGYNWYRVTAWNERLGRRVLGSSRRSGARRRGARGSSPAFRRPVRRYASRSFLALDRGPRALHCENFAPFPDALRRQLLADPAARNGTDPYARWLRAHDEGGGSTLDADGPRRPADVRRRAADEAGSDEHGRFDREPRAVSRPRAG